MKHKLLILFFILGSYTVFSQVVVGKVTPTSESSQLEVYAKNKGVLIPRIALTGSRDETTMYNGNINSLLVFNTATVSDITPGYYYWHIDKWHRMAAADEIKAISKITINPDTGDIIVKYIDGTTDNAGNVKGSKGDKGDTGTGISSTAIDPATGNLIITYTDGRTFDAGKVKGDTGAKGETGAKGDTGTGISSTAIDPATGNLIITYTDGRTFDAGKVKGDTGAKGETGAKGDTGTGISSTVIDPATGNLIITYTDGRTFDAGKVKGDTGAKGETGAKGDTGTGISSTVIDPATGNLIITYTDGRTFDAGKVKGNKGDDGAVGPQGPQGIAGTNGADGAVGPQGPQGIAGTNGADGAVGPQGPQGIAGTNGADGAVGPQGPQGIPGTNGIDGADGPQGPQGIAGTNGADGAVGPQGPQGIPGTNGIDGADGAVGPQGPQGIAGTNGADGAVGPQGPQGIPGTNGIDGAVGPQGPQGIAGTNGIDGANGPQGPQGIPGTNGADGAVGPQGLQGIPGTNGADGSVGPQGPQGIAGTNGAVGPQGLRGIPGTNGADGAVGPQGPQGPKGETGATPTITKGSVVAGSTSVLVTGTGKVLDANITVDVVKKNLTSTTSNKVLAIVGGTSTTLADTQINLVPAVNKPAYLYTDQNGAVAWSPDMPWVLGGNDGSDGLTSEKKFGTLTNFDIPFFTNNTEKMRLTKTGLLGIGTSKPRYGIHLVNETNTTADDNKDDLKLSTYSTAAVSPSFSFLKSNGTEATPTPMTSGMAMGAFNFQAQTTNGDANGLGGFQSLTSVTAYYEGGSGSSAKSNLEFKTSNTLNLEIANNGDLLPGTTATTGTINLGNINQRWRALYAANGTIQTSDIRLKQNIKPLNYGLIDVLKIDPISYTWKSDKFDKVKLGVSAQQLQTILPEIVEVGTDDAKTLGVNYADMIPVLINAIKEQQKQIDELKNEIKEMKSKQ